LASVETRTQDGRLSLRRPTYYDPSMRTVLSIDPDANSENMCDLVERPRTPGHVAGRRRLEQTIFGGSTPARAASGSHALQIPHP
jgi:hypothetical protein